MPEIDRTNRDMHRPRRFSFFNTKKRAGLVVCGVAVAAALPFSAAALSSDDPEDADDPVPNTSQNAEVTINGESVALPDSGKIHKEYHDEHTSSSVDIDVQGSTSPSTVSSTNRIEVHTESSSVIDSGGP